jgi:hypothetical protein
MVHALLCSAARRQAAASGATGSESVGAPRYRLYRRTDLSWRPSRPTDSEPDRSPPAAVSPAGCPVPARAVPPVLSHLCGSSESVRRDQAQLLAKINPAPV